MRILPKNVYSFKFTQVSPYKELYGTVSALTEKSAKALIVSKLKKHEDDEEPVGTLEIYPIDIKTSDVHIICAKYSKV